MAKLTLQYDGTTAGRTLERNMQRASGAVSLAILGAARDAADEILSRGQDDIKSAGNYGTAWVQGLHTSVSATADRVTVNVTHDQGSIYGFLNKGGVIQAKHGGLMWIPLSYTGLKVPASASGLELFAVKRKSGGVPLLLSKSDRMPKYFGIPSVTVKKKFHIVEIIRDVAGRMKDFYKARFQL